DGSPHGRKPDSLAVRGLPLQSRAWGKVRLRKHLRCSLLHMVLRIDPGVGGTQIFSPREQWLPRTVYSTGPVEREIPLVVGRPRRPADPHLVIAQLSPVTDHVWVAASGAGDS